MTDPTQPDTAERLAILGIDLEIARSGTGRPILALHGFQPLDPRADFMARLGRHGHVIAPSHPGFGHSPRPDGFETVYDLVHLYLEMLERLQHAKVALVGFSFGGWLAAEIAVKCCHRIDKLILVDSLGIKLGDRETMDILDVFNKSPDAVRRASWHDPAASAPVPALLSDQDIILRARNWDALCLYGWHPYMYNPRLKHWLARITVPTLVVWGASDGIVKPSYGRALSALIPASRFALIEGAGHHPEIERPAALVDAIAAFLNH